MIEATQAYHPKVLTTIRCLAEYYAREEAKHQIKARGEKISDYLPREINVMAHLLLVTRPHEFVERAKASSVVEEVRQECEAKDQHKLERNLKDLHKARSLDPQ